MATCTCDCTKSVREEKNCHGECGEKGKDCGCCTHCECETCGKEKEPQI